MADDHCKELRKKHARAMLKWIETGGRLGEVKAKTLSNGEEMPVVYAKLKESTEDDNKARDEYFKTMHELIECLKKPNTLEK